MSGSRSLKDFFGLSFCLQVSYESIFLAAFGSFLVQEAFKVGQSEIRKASECLYVLDLAGFINRRLGTFWKVI